MALTDAEQDEILAKVRAIDLRMVQQQERAAVQEARSARMLGWLTYLGEYVAGQRRHSASQMVERVKKLAP